MAVRVEQSFDFQYLLQLGQRPAILVRNRFTQKERFRMAMAYLKNHEYLTVKKYAKMTELSKAAAKAELDAFVADKERPLETVIRGKKKVYILRK